MTPEIRNHARLVLQKCRDNDIRLSTVESCTGGLIIAALTDIPGSSDVVECGFITYANEAKTSMVGVSVELIDMFGAVSKPVAIAMAEGALKNSNSKIAVAVTGIAGPDGGSEEKPVGLVHLAVSHIDKPTYHYDARFGNLERESIRNATVIKAFELITEMI